MTVAEKLLRVFFSFDYERDLHRVGKIRQLPGIVAGAAAGFQSATVWNQAKRRGDAAVHGLINDALNNTTVTVICIGYMTSYRRHLVYELERSLERGNGVLGLNIAHLTNQQGLADKEGTPPPLIEIAGYKIYTYNNKPDLVRYIREAAEMAVEQQQDEYQRRFLTRERQPE